VSARVDWAKGGEARIVSIAANVIVLRSTVPAPPGSRIEGTVAGAGLVLRVKVHASRREGHEKEEFMLQGRPLDLTREARERLAAMVREGEARGDRGEFTE
jgi:hypothetical protein